MNKKVCDCRNIYDSDANWKEKVMADDFKCGLCQMRLIHNDTGEDENLADIPSAESVLNDYLNHINQ